MIAHDIEYKSLHWWSQNGQCQIRIPHDSICLECRSVLLQSPCKIAILNIDGYWINIENLHLKGPYSMWTKHCLSSCTYCRWRNTHGDTYGSPLLSTVVHSAEGMQFSDANFGIEWQHSLDTLIVVCVNSNGRFSMGTVVSNGKYFAFAIYRDGHLSSEEGLRCRS